jgi:DnaJ-class molecular chaperone
MTGYYKKCRKCNGEGEHRVEGNVFACFPCNGTGEVFIKSSVNYVNLHEKVATKATEKHTDTNKK